MIECFAHFVNFENFAYFVYSDFLVEFVEDICGIDFLATGMAEDETSISASFSAEAKISSSFLFLILLLGPVRFLATGRFFAGSGSGAGSGGEKLS